MNKLSTINGRIAQVVEHSGLTKTAFGERINISQPHVSRLCSNGVPSDRTIVDICREFSVDEVWLRTGEGEMLRRLSRSEEIAAYMADVLGGLRSPAEEALISTLSRLPPDFFPMLDAALDIFIAELSNAKEKDKD